VETVFVLIADWSPGSRIKLKRKSAGNQRQHIKRKIHHAFPKATGVPSRTRDGPMEFARAHLPNRTAPGTGCPLSTNRCSVMGQRPNAWRRP